MFRSLSVILLLGLAAFTGAMVPPAGPGRDYHANPAPARIASHRYVIVVAVSGRRPSIRFVQRRFMAIPGVDDVTVDIVNLTVVVTMRPGASLRPDVAAAVARRVGLTVRDFHAIGQGMRG